MTCSKATTFVSVITNCCVYVCALFCGCLLLLCAFISYIYFAFLCSGTVYYALKYSNNAFGLFVSKNSKPI